MLFKWMTLVALAVGIPCILVGGYLNGPASLKIRDFLRQNFRESVHQKTYIAAFAYDLYIPLEVRRQYFISTMLMGIALVCLAVLMFLINDIVAKVLAPVMGVGVVGGMFWETRRYLKSTRPR
ncbi:hypothetical protein [Nitratidesulfovibrio liaohensis]|uniref:Uncharacterized protein n=1 Tax=Nitratidesulfovibrio liaohensis TaxID=2604158 RepID=A0ABY9R3J0_9BACT|nr:hypothetical protein [Nitratidesulfovibrio liaohensis]WMW66019.1 hypothetical protein KPS_000561 [Nitratidesulfovibrio liaohensis]